MMPKSSNDFSSRTALESGVAFFGAAEARVSVVVGQPPAEEGSAPPAAGEKHDALDDLLAFGAQFDNIKIQ